MRCDVCGNEYDKAFQVTKSGRTGAYDSFECAIHAMAPRCAHCQCKMYCCAHCARQMGESAMRDRV